MDSPLKKKKTNKKESMPSKYCSKYNSLVDLE